MKISRIEVRNFRALHDVDVPLHDYTTFIGPNGAGKSTFLYALDWFFGNRTISKDDLTNCFEAESISVCVTFTHLTQRDRARLATFVCDNQARFTRSLDVKSGVSSYTGTAMLAPGFDSVLSEHRVTYARRAYKQLREQFASLPELKTDHLLEEAKSACLDWIKDPANCEALEMCEQAADSFFSTAGSLGDLCQFILIKGALDLASETDTAAKGSMLSVLTNSLIDGARNQTIEKWRLENTEAIAELRRSTREAVHTAITSKMEAINQGLARYVAHRRIDLQATDPEVDVRYPTNITASIGRADGSTLPVSNHGHGLQRAVVMSMIEALHTEAGNNNGDVTKTVILAAEEPEIYQHPVRARAFAQSLQSLAANDGFQVVIATHSPSFVSSDFMDSLRFTRMVCGTTCVRHSSVERVTEIRGHHIEKTREWLSREVPKAFADAFFADLVVLVEGGTDEWVIPELADLLGTPLEQQGIVILSTGGKSSIASYKSVLEEFGLPTFVVFDGDYCDDDPDADSEKKQSCKQQTEECVRDLGLHDGDGRPRYKYGCKSKILNNVAVFQKKIERELDKWPSFQEALRPGNYDKAAKKPYRYRRAARSASAEDVPEFLHNLIRAIIQISEGNQ